MHNDPNPAFDPNDPHHFSELGEHHGHHITSARMLVTVILSLVVLTALTIFASKFETYLTTEMGWVLPDWLNVAVAMGIAVVKGAMVLMFFMALKYENPLYTIVFLFCMFAFALFIALTGLDLDNRGHLYDWKRGAITYGGIGGSISARGGTIHDEHTEGGKVAMQGGGFSGPLTEYLKAKYIEETGITEAEYMRRWAEANHIHLEDPAHAWSNADRSLPRHGLSGALDEHPAAADHTEQPAGH